MSPLSNRLYFAACGTMEKVITVTRMSIGFIAFQLVLIHTVNTMPLTHEFAVRRGLSIQKVGNDCAFLFSFKVEQIL